MARNGNNNSFNDMGGFSGFLQRNRKGIFLIAGLIILAFAGLVVFITLSSVLNKNAIAEIEELGRIYEELRISSQNANYAADMDKLLAEIELFAKNKKGYAPGKAWSMIALVYADREDWPKAKDAWLNAADAGKKTFLGPIALFNAAAAEEEMGNFERAIELLQSCLSHPFEFPSAPRAQFAIGRLYEKQKNYPAALEAYREVLIKWHDFPMWQNLARDRVIAIEVN